MKQFSRLEFIRLVKKNGYFYDRNNGDHVIYVNNEGRHISIPETMQCVIARRLIKENNLIVPTKKKKRI